MKCSYDNKKIIERTIKMNDYKNHITKSFLDIVNLLVNKEVMIKRTLAELRVSN